MEYRDPSPYPPAEVSARDPARIPPLTALYSGTAGELTAILQYSFQRFALCQKDPELGKTLMGIGMVEMHHLELLGELITRLGGVPAFWDARRSPWNAGAVSCRRDICSLLLKDMQDETRAMQDYLQTARRMGDPKIAAVLRRIALDEACHIRILQRLIAQQGCRRQG